MAPLPKIQPAAAGHPIPDGVSPEAASLLQRAYTLDSTEASRQLYRDWAQSYDQTMLQGLGYLSPARVADLLARHLPGPMTPVLDIGCGTGLAAQALAAHGCTCIDGLDLSPPMMQMARRRGVYRHLIAADLNRPLPLAAQHYGGAMCSGTFTHAHVGAACLDELWRLLRPGAPFVFTVHLGVWQSMGFEATLHRLEQQGVARRIEARAGVLYRNSPQPDGLFCLYQRC